MKLCDSGSIANSGLALRLAKLHPAALAEFAAAPGFGGLLVAFVAGEQQISAGTSS